MSQFASRVLAGIMVIVTALSAMKPVEAAQVRASQRVHPVLIRNEHNPVLKLTIEADSEEKVAISEVAVSLDDTDDLADVSALRLFVGNEKGEFSSQRLLGEIVDLQQLVTFKLQNFVSDSKSRVLWIVCELKSTADLSHQVGLQLQHVRSGSETLTTKNEAPGARHRIGIALRKHNDDGVHTYRIPALATSHKGSLLCVYDMRRRTSRDLQEDIDIGLSRSTDGGKSWESPRVIMDMGTYNGLGQEQNGCSDPGIIVDHQTGTIFVFAVWMWGKPGQHQWAGKGSEPGFEIGKTAQFMVVKSEDDGLTWSPSENLTRTLKQAAWWLLAPSPQQGFQRDDGTLVMPIQGRDATGEQFSTIMSSRDHGKSWQVGQAAGSGICECQAALLSNGSIMLNARNTKGKSRAVYVTSDFGKSWIEHPTSRQSLIEPTCNGSLLRVRFNHSGNPEQALLFANPCSQKARENHSIRVSWDDGATWSESFQKLLDDGRGRGYSSLTQIDGDHVGIVYEGSQSDVMFERLSLSDDLLRPDLRPLGKGVRIAMIGDSTMSNYPQDRSDRGGLTGWGQVFQEFFDDSVTVSNYALSGRSTKSFRAEGHWAKVLKERADFVFIQFGHNDQKGKGPERETDAAGGYQQNLRRYISEARAAGMRPVLVTPVARRTFQDGHLTTSLGPYAEATQRVARLTGTPVIDLHDASFRRYAELGDAGSADFNPVASDRTHFSRKGAIEIARLVAERLPASVLSLKPRLKAK